MWLGVNLPNVSGAAISFGRNPTGVAHNAPPQDPAINSGIRKAGFYCALCVVFLRYSLLHEVLTEYGGSNGKVLYIFSIPALLCLLLSGGFQRFFAARPSRYWLGFVAWLFICVPFSFWRGDSASYALSYLRTDLPMMVFLGCLPMTWKECRMVLYTIALAGIASVSFSRIFGMNYGGRLGLTFGTMANPNDYACILILALPFMIFMVLRPMAVFFPIRMLIQLVTVVAICYAFYLVVASGSRGAVIAVFACVLFIFFKSTGAVRIALLAVIPLAVGAVIVTLPGNVLARLQSFTADVRSASGDELEAAESTAIRKGLLQASIKDTFTHPLFGVGPGQFPNFEGKSKSFFEGGFITPHNSYAQIACEMGFPGIFLYLAGAVSAFLSLQRAWKLASSTPQAKEMATACFLVSVSYIGYCVAITFLNFGYFFYLPAFAGLVIALSAAVKRETDMLSASEGNPERVERPLVFAGQRPALRMAPGRMAPGKPRPVFSPNRFGFDPQR